MNMLTVLSFHDQVVPRVPIQTQFDITHLKLTWVVLVLLGFFMGMLCILALDCKNKLI